MAVTGVVFRCREQQSSALPLPAPAAQFLPDYYSTMRRDTESGEGTAKRCVPFLEASCLGYIIPLWADLRITNAAGKQSAELVGGESLGVGGHSLEQLPGSDIQTIFKLVSPWVIETPEGYSCLFTNPMNRVQRDINLFDGVVTTDKYYNAVNFPFYVTSNREEIIIPAGTPIAQVIPFARQKLSYRLDHTDVWREHSTKYILSKHRKDGYRKEFWSPA